MTRAAYERSKKHATCSTSPQWGEVGSRRDPGEGARAYGESPAPSPQPSPQWGEGARRVCGEACASSLLLLARAHHLLLQNAPALEAALHANRGGRERRGC